MGLLPPLIRLRPTLLWHVILFSVLISLTIEAGQLISGRPRAGRGRPHPQHVGRNNRLSLSPRDKTPRRRRRRRGRPATTDLRRGVRFRKRMLRILFLNLTLSLLRDPPCPVGRPAPGSPPIVATIRSVPAVRPRHHVWSRPNPRSWQYHRPAHDDRGDRPGDQRPRGHDGIAAVITPAVITSAVVPTTAEIPRRAGGHTDGHSRARVTERKPLRVHPRSRKQRIQPPQRPPTTTTSNSSSWLMLPSNGPVRVMFDFFVPRAETVRAAGNGRNLTTAPLSRRSRRVFSPVPLFACSPLSRSRGSELRPTASYRATPCKGSNRFYNQASASRSVGLAPRPFAKRGAEITWRMLLWTLPSWPLHSAASVGSRRPLKKERH